MPSDPESDPAPLDFSRRAHLSEWMDEPCSYEEFRACLVDLATVNKLTFAHRPTRTWLARLIERASAAGTLLEGAPLHVVDVGSGQGDMLRSLARWARGAGIQLSLTGIDLNPYAARAAAEQTRAGEQITWITGDAFSLTPTRRIDVVISSLFTHHLADAEIVRFLGWMEHRARLGWFVNDLARGPVQYHLFRAAARLAGWHRFVQHDGPVSIRRAFSFGDWRRYLADAGLGEIEARIENFRPARLCVGRIK